MKIRSTTGFAALLVLILSTAFAATASAECGFAQGHKSGPTIQHQSWDSSQFNSARLLLTSDHHDAGIVGFWKVLFLAKGNPDIPDDTPIDSALVVWHSDGTEIMNSGRPAQDGNFCMGVWEKVGKSKYKLNHFALGNDPNGNPAGPTHIVETVFLSHDENHYAGTFTLDATDTTGSSTSHIVGIITATRITVHTPSVF